LEPVGERRPVTVLFVDIAGFTKMSSHTDAEEIHRILGRFFEVVDGIVAGYGGSIDKHIGDNVMAVFGAPVAHGDDPARAVRAAIDIHKAMPSLVQELGVSLQVHAGIASGQVVASDTGSSHHTEYTVTGETVNLASRLEGLAGADETLISDSVYRSIPGLAECEDRGDTTVKGIEKPVRVWHVRALADGGGDRARLPFVGRRPLLTQFEGTLTGCEQSQAGQTVLLRGEAGIGKTRLLDEIAAAARRHGFRCHKGLILDFGVGKGQDAIAMLVRSLLGVRGGAQIDFAANNGMAGEDDRMFLYDLLGLPQPDELRVVHDAMDSDAREAGKRKAISTVVQNASRQTPLLLAIEDVHWAGRGTLEQLAGLAAIIEDCPAILVMTSRIEGDPIDRSWRAKARSPLVTIDLEPLRQEEALSLAGNLFDSTNRFVMNCVERSNGNPLFLEQLLRNAEESEEENIPDSIQSLVMARLDRLDSANKRALQAASILGQRFGLEVLRSLLGNPSYDCLPLLEHGLLRPEGEDFLFAHALIREGVSASLLKSTRHQLHARAAEWYSGRDAVLFAEHLDRAADPRAPRAYLDAAAAEATAFRFEQALAMADRGLELVSDRGEQISLICRRGDLLRDLGLVEDSIVAFGEAADLADSDADASRAQIGRAEGMRLTDQIDEALAALDEAQAAARRANLDLPLARIHHLRGNLIFPFGRIEECRKEHESALELARSAGNVEFEAAALGGLGDAAYASGRMKTSHDYFVRCMEVCRQHGLGRVEVANRSMVGWTYIYLNRLRDALEESLAVADMAVRLGHPRGELGGRHCAAYLLNELGRPEEALTELDKALPVCRKLGALRFEAQNMNFRAIVLWQLGKKGEALSLFDQALAKARHTGERFIGPYILASMARRTDDAAVRRHAMQEAERILAKGTVAHNVFWFHREAMQSALERGEWNEARRRAAALEEFTRPEPLPWSDFFVAYSRVLADCGEGRHDGESVAELKRLREVADTVGFLSSVAAIDEALSSLRTPE
jgi:class 3 adenylate cyclase/tetratricopeptide (TPR) repeat protein